jgi:hypothetical protein
MLEDLFGNHALIRTLDFLLENRFWDYTKKDIAKEANVSRTQLYRFWPILERLELVKETRKIGATRLYKVNLDSSIIRALEVLSLEIENHLNKKILEEGYQRP